MRGNWKVRRSQLGEVVAIEPNNEFEHVFTDGVDPFDAALQYAAAQLRNEEAGDAATISPTRVRVMDRACPSIQEGLTPPAENHATVTISMTGGKDYDNRASQLRGES